MPVETKGSARPSEYASNKTDPRATVVVDPARTRIVPSTGPDTRRGADREGRTEQRPRAPTPRAADEAWRDEALGERQQADERKPENDDNKAGHRLHPRRVQRDGVADEASPPRRARRRAR